MNATLDSTSADPEQIIADLRRQLAEAREQQAATAEVLEVINSSPGDLTPVFDTILERAHKLCDVASGSLQLFEGDAARVVAVRGLSDTYASWLRQGGPPRRIDNRGARPLLAGAPFNQIIDLAQSEFPRA